MTLLKGRFCYYVAEEEGVTQLGKDSVVEHGK